MNLINLFDRNPGLGQDPLNGIQRQMRRKPDSRAVYGSCKTPALPAMSDGMLLYETQRFRPIPVNNS